MMEVIQREVGGGGEATQSFLGGTKGCAHNDGGVRAGDKDLRRVGAAQVHAAAGGGAIGWESWERGRKVVRGCAHNDGVVRLRQRAVSIVSDRA